MFSYMYYNKSCYLTKSYSLYLGSVGATNMNEHSSRSHAIFTITIECSEKGVDGNQHVRMGKLHLVDLAVCIWGYKYQTKNRVVHRKLAHTHASKIKIKALPPTIGLTTSN